MDLKRGKMIKTKIKIPEINRLIERTGSLPRKVNSRRRLVIPEVFRDGGTGLEGMVCMLLLL